MDTGVFAASCTALPHELLPKQAQRRPCKADHGAAFAFAGFRV